MWAFRAFPAFVTGHVHVLQTGWMLHLYCEILHKAHREASPLHGQHLCHFNQKSNNVFHLHSAQGSNTQGC